MGPHASSLSSMNDQQPLNLSFGPIAEAYERGRPEYSEETAAWLLAGQEPGRVLEILELGAGTGKLTRALTALGHVVHATDADEGMLDVLARTVPQARTALGTAEKIPFGDRMFDVVVAAQSFHWFEAETALAEIARVLRPSGQLALVWHEWDVKIPWVRRLKGVLGDGGLGTGGVESSVEPLIVSRHFGVVEEAVFNNWQHINSEVVLDLALSRSHIASLGAEERQQKLAEVLAFYDDFGRGMDGMELRYRAACYRARVIERAQPVTPPAAEVEAPSGDDPLNDTRERPRTETWVVDPARDTTVRDEDADGRAHEIFRSDGTDTDMLLIDFR